MARPYANQSKEQLLKLKKDSESLGMIVAEIDAELLQRELEENFKSMKTDIQKLTIPHWTRNWTFYLVVAALIVSLAALALQWRADIRASQSPRVSSPVTSPSTTTTPNLPPISTQKKQISQGKSVPKKP